jgi:hypothetical protein
LCEIKTHKGNKEERSVINKELYDETGVDNVEDMEG